MTPEQFSKANAELRNKSPLEIVRWAIAQSHARAIVSTNFRPYEAVILHLCVQVQPDLPVLWVDHGYNRPDRLDHRVAPGAESQSRRSRHRLGRQKFRHTQGQPGFPLDRRRNGELSQTAQPAERMGLLRPRESRRETRVRLAH